MARISINKASQEFQISRNSLYKHIKQGKITKDADGKLDTSDLVRLYGSHVNTQQESTTVHTQDEQLLLQQIEQLKHQVKLLENQIEYFKTNEAWLKQQLDQKLIEHKSSEKKGILGRIFG